MGKNERAVNSIQEIIKALLLQKAAEKSSSLRWNKYSLMFIYITLVIVLLLRLESVNFTIIAVVAVVGLGFFLLFANWQGKKLEKQFYEQERAYYQSLFPDNSSNNFDLASPPGQSTLLSRREMEVLLYIVKGNTNKQIALAMDITNQTVKNHITSILRKMEVPDRTSAAVTALSQGWIKHNGDGQIEIAGYLKDASGEK